MECMGEDGVLQGAAEKELYRGSTNGGAETYAEALCEREGGRNAQKDRDRGPCLMAQDRDRVRDSPTWKYSTTEEGKDSCSAFATSECLAQQAGAGQSSHTAVYT